MLGGFSLFGFDEDNDICRCFDFGFIVGSFNFFVFLCVILFIFDKIIFGILKWFFFLILLIVFCLIIGVGLLLYFFFINGGNMDNLLRDDFFVFFC